MTDEQYCRRKYLTAASGTLAAIIGGCSQQETNPTETTPTPTSSPTQTDEETQTPEQTEEPKSDEEIIDEIRSKNWDLLNRALEYTPPPKDSDDGQGYNRAAIDLLETINDLTYFIDDDSLHRKSGGWEGIPISRDNTVEEAKFGVRPLLDNLNVGTSITAYSELPQDEVDKILMESEVDKNNFYKVRTPFEDYDDFEVWEAVRIEDPFAIRCNSKESLEYSISLIEGREQTIYDQDSNGVRKLFDPSELYLEISVNGVPTYSNNNLSDDISNLLATNTPYISSVDMIYIPEDGADEFLENGTVKEKVTAFNKETNTWEVQPDYSHEMDIDRLLD